MHRVLNYLKDLFSWARLKAFFFILLFLLMGEVISYLFALPVGGNIIGMVLLFVALKYKWVPLRAIKPASDKLIEFLVVFFIPYGVGLMVYFDLIKSYWLPLSIAVIASTLLTLYVTAIILQKSGK
ncbi:CidA/LrgA family protein [Salinimicrobium sp. MT39]|uniref:CidA/LrgA family protein n=1 Tax=Salinimicrobium profundisediminis TaxID=2994553 RepID=A0A9X3CZM5_9FLAO|nr:CidA/LrgA family protein [Salinimicrobium profundisediminis]MCX2838569.1 CidA/LrgA family protein [Salinimicrobium profundisediminis]